MVHHIADASNESGGSWLPIIEYSVKSGVSLSTIRRKIKSNSIPYKLEKGKYLILFQEGNVPAPEMTAPRGILVQAPAILSQPQPHVVHAPKASVTKRRADQIVGADEEDHSAVRMLSEAYEHALHEKDARIRLLEKRVREQEERLNELKLLVHVLEEKYEVRY